MKLYFYILDADSSNPKGLYVKECEAEEKPKTYSFLFLYNIINIY